MERRRLTEEDREFIYASTDGHCHLCRKKLSYVNYNRPSRRGAWHVEHSHPVANGGTSYLRNLKPACIDCNLEKGVMTTRTARGWSGFRKAPLSRERKQKLRERNTFIGVGAGAAAGGMLFGPPGVLVGAFLGGLGGHSLDPDSE